MGEQVVKCVHECFRTRNIADGLNTSFLVLVSKAKSFEFQKFTDINTSLPTKLSWKLDAKVQGI